MLPPGKNSGCTTYESVVSAMRPDPTSSSAESRAGPAADPNAGRNRFSMSSSDSTPPPP